jgi:hypothetical protein
MAVMAASAAVVVVMAWQSVATMAAVVLVGWS